VVFSFFNSKKAARRSHFSHAKNFPMGVILDSAKAQLVFSLEQGLVVTEKASPYAEELQEIIESPEEFATPTINVIEKTLPVTERLEEPEKHPDRKAKRGTKPAPIQIDTEALSEASETTDIQAPESPLDDISLNKPKKISEAKRLALLENAANNASGESSIPEESPPSVDSAPKKSKRPVASESDDTPLEEAPLVKAKPSKPALKPLPSKKKPALEAKPESSLSTEAPETLLPEPISTSDAVTEQETNPIPEPLQPLSWPLTVSSTRHHLVAKVTPSQDTPLNKTQPVHGVSLKATWHAQQASSKPEVKTPLSIELPEPDAIFFDLQPLSDVILHASLLEDPVETKTHLSLQDLSQTPSALRAQISESTPPTQEDLPKTTLNTPQKATQSLSILHLTAGFNPNATFEEDFVSQSLAEDDPFLEISPVEDDLGLIHPETTLMPSDKTLLFDEGRIHAQNAQLVRILITLDKTCLLLLEQQGEHGDSHLALAADNGQALGILKTLPWQDPDTLAIHLETTRLPKKILCAVTVGTWQGIICEDPRGIRLEAEVMAVE
jgi:hypothetical protein